MRDARRGQGAAPSGLGSARSAGRADWPDSPVHARRKARARRSPFGAGVGEIGRLGRLAGFPCSCALRGRSEASAPKGAGLGRSSGQIGAGQLPLGELRVAPRRARAAPLGLGHFAERPDRSRSTPPWGVADCAQEGEGSPFGAEVGRRTAGGISPVGADGREKGGGAAGGPIAGPSLPLDLDQCSIQTPHSQGAISLHCKCKDMAKSPP